MSRGPKKLPDRPHVDPSRLAAYDVLVAVREHDAYANLVLPLLLREREITGRDAAFTISFSTGMFCIGGALLLKVRM